jgi:hypothetical protein
MNRKRSMKVWLRELSRWLLAVALIQACQPKANFPAAELNRVSSDERVDDWRVSGEKKCPRVIQAIDGCYVLEVKYVADYRRVKGGTSRLWGLSPLAAAIDTAVRTRTTNYETDYVLFALPVRRQHSYYVTATFDGDEFAPRVVETNAAAERTQEIFPAASLQELELCKRHGPRISAEEQDVCAAPVPVSPARPW